MPAHRACCQVGADGRAAGIRHATRLCSVRVLALPSQRHSSVLRGEPYMVIKITDAGVAKASHKDGQQDHDRSRHESHNRLLCAQHLLAALTHG